MGDLLTAKFCTTLEATQILDCTDTSVRAWWRENKLPDPVLIGRRAYLWDRQAVLALKARRAAEKDAR